MILTKLLSVQKRGLKIKEQSSQKLNLPFDLRNTYQEDVEFTSTTCSISIGAFTYGVDKLHIHSWGGAGSRLSIGRFCSIAADLTVILGGNHRMDWITTYPFGFIHNSIFQGLPEPSVIYSKGDVRILNDVWIGSNVTILSGVTVGNGAVIGAGSVVTKSVQSYEVVAGNPAEHIRFRFPSRIVSELESIAWWEMEQHEISKIIEILQGDPSPDNLKKIRDLGKK